VSKFFLLIEKPRKAVLQQSELRADRLFPGFQVGSTSRSRLRHRKSLSGESFELLEEPGPLSFDLMAIRLELTILQVHNLGASVQALFPFLDHLFARSDPLLFLDHIESPLLEKLVVFVEFHDAEPGILHRDVCPRPHGLGLRLPSCEFAHPSFVGTLFPPELCLKCLLARSVLSKLFLEPAQAPPLLLETLKRRSSLLIEFRPRFNPLGLPSELWTFFLIVLLFVLLIAIVRPRRRPIIESAFLIDQTGRVRFEFAIPGTPYDEGRLQSTLRGVSWKGLGQVSDPPYTLHIKPDPNGDWIFVSRTSDTDRVMKSAEKLISKVQGDVTSRKKPRLSEGSS